MPVYELKCPYCMEIIVTGFPDFDDLDMHISEDHRCFCGDSSILGVAHRSHECLHIGPQLDV